MNGMNQSKINRKFLPAMLIFGIASCVLMFFFLLSLMSESFYNTVVYPISWRIQNACYVATFAAALLYLLLSALAHFSTGKAVGLWFGILIPFLCEIGAILLVNGLFPVVEDQIYDLPVDFVAILNMPPLYLLIGYPFPIPTIAYVLFIIAIVKKDIRIGWVAAASLFGFCIGFLLGFPDGGLSDIDVIGFAWMPFAAICVFIIMDLCYAIKSVRKKPIES